MCCNEFYDAVPVSDAHGWSRRTQKYIMLGLVSFGFLATADITGIALMPRGSQNEGSSGINTPSPPRPSLQPSWLRKCSVLEHSPIAQRGLKVE